PVQQVLDAVGERRGRAGAQFLADRFGAGGGEAVHAVEEVAVGEAGGGAVGDPYVDAARPRIHGGLGAGGQQVTEDGPPRGPPAEQAGGDDQLVLVVLLGQTAGGPGQLGVPA